MSNDWSDIAALNVQVCKYNDRGILERHHIDILSTPYIAVSHIWTSASWHTDINNVDWEVLASSQKAHWLNTQLPTLVQHDFFWMDILCVDQRSAEARIGVVGMIPDIYRNAEKTIVVREPGGIQACCASAIGDFVAWHNDGHERFAEHLRTSHIDGIQEVWFDRLWPLQELILSDSVLFTICEGGLISQEQPLGVDTDYFAAHLSFRRISDSLYCAAQAWLQYAMESDIYEWEFKRFIYAFINNQFVARRPREVSRQNLRDLSNDFSIHLNSLRITSKPRDFILAILPQYGWYKVPKNVKARSFGELWLDCVQQAEARDFGFNAAIIEGLVSPRAKDSKTSRSATAEIPIPRTLGDFIKLFGEHQQPATDDYGEIVPWGKLIADVQVDEVSSCSMVDTIALVRNAMEFSPTEWRLAHRGDLSAYGLFPIDRSMTALQVDAISKREGDFERMSEAEQKTFLEVKRKVMEKYDRETNDPNFVFEESIKTLNLMWTGLFESDLPATADWRDFEKDLIGSDPPQYQEKMVRLAALISCGFGISFFGWSVNKLLVPGKIKVCGQEIIVLARLHENEHEAASESEEQPQRHHTKQAYCVQLGGFHITGRDIVLVDRESMQVFGKVPDFKQRSLDMETDYQRVRKLYPDQNWILSDPAPGGDATN